MKPTIWNASIHQTEDDNGNPLYIAVAVAQIVGKLKVAHITRASKVSAKTAWDKMAAEVKKRGGVIVQGE